MLSNLALPLVLKETTWERDAEFVLDWLKKVVRLVTRISAVRVFAANIAYLDILSA